MTKPKRVNGNDAAWLLAHPTSPIERQKDAPDHPQLFDLAPLTVATDETGRAPEDES